MLKKVTVMRNIENLKHCLDIVYIVLTDDRLTRSIIDVNFLNHYCMVEYCSI